MHKLLFSFFFPLGFIIFSWSFFQKTFERTYNLIILSNSITNGTIRSVNRVDAPNGTFFDCRVEYKVGSNYYFLDGTISYDTNPNVLTGDKIEVRYNLKNPQKATIDLRIDLIGHLLIALSLFAWMTGAFVLLIK